MNYSIGWLMANDGFECACGKRHYGLLKDCIIGEDALLRLPEMLRKYGGTHPFILCDTLTYEAAGKAVTELLKKENIPFTIGILLGFCTAAYTANHLLSTNYMFLRAGDGTPYDILYRLVNGHPVLYPLGVVVLFLLYIVLYYRVCFLIRGMKNHKRAAKMA